jgi:hypothetical protein
VIVPTLVVYRPARYRARALKYFIIVDGEGEPVGLSDLDAEEFDLSPGKHDVRIFLTARRFVEFELSLAHDNNRVVVTPRSRPLHPWGHAVNVAWADSGERLALVAGQLSRDDKLIVRNKHQR